MLVHLLNIAVYNMNLAMAIVMKKKVNKAYLDDEIAVDKEILLSNNPKDIYYLNNGQPQFNQRELDYLEELNFTFEDVGNGLWKAIKNMEEIL